ncbi:MAG: hypothetical protein IJW03_02765 [Clostridia bacterium]|nr:hypothetical protein [Clostridia bacterium]
MIQMLGLVTLLYFVTLALIAFNRDRINIKIANRIFIALDIILYVFWMYGCYLGGARMTLFTLIGNISPLTCVVMAMTPIFSDKVRSHAYCAIAFLNFGLFVAMLISPEHAYLFNFYEEAKPTYTAEALCHMICSLYGIYLILTRQVKPDFDSWIKAIKFLYPIILTGVVFNAIFHQKLFGMDPYGDYSIYMIDIFGSFTATFIAYLLGVLLVLTLGLQVGRLLDRLTSHKNESSATSLTAPTNETCSCEMTQAEKNPPQDENKGD